MSWDSNLWILRAICSMLGYISIIFLLLARYSASGLIGCHVDIGRRFLEISTFLETGLDLSVAVILGVVFRVVVFGAVAFVMTLGLSPVPVAMLNALGVVETDGSI